MLKRKISLSLVMALTLVLVFSMTALAAGVVNLTLTNVREVLTANWTADADVTVTGYNVKLEEGTTTKTTVEEIDSQTSTTFIYNTLIAGKTYTLTVKTLGGINDGLTSVKTIVLPTAVGVTIKAAKFDDANKVLSLTWTKDAYATSYTVVDKDISGTAVTKYTSPDIVNPAGDVSHTATVNLDPSKKYSVDVVTNGGWNNTGKSTINGWTPALNPELSSTDKDNGLMNANQTGKGVTVNDGSTNTDVIKLSTVKNDGTTGTQRTHGEYQNNTNSCASCHQTHTGASKSLLFKDGVYNTCTACHDGTLGFYNVFESSNAGTFGGTHDGNMSVHLADGTVQVKAAPGGNLAANSGSWINEFNCASCHAPHGSYSERLLHYNPNGMGLAPSIEGGIGLKAAQIYNFPLPTTTTTNSAKQILVRGTGTNFDLVADDIDGEVPGETKVIFAYDLSGTTYVKSTKPWLYGYNHASPNKNYFTRFFDGAYTTTQAFIQKTDDGLQTGKKLYTDNLLHTEVQTSKDSAGNFNDPVMVLAYTGADLKVTQVVTATLWYDQFELTFDKTTGTWHYKWVVDNHDQDWNDDVVIKWNKGFIYAANSSTILNDLDTGDVGRAYTVDLDLVEIARFGDANGVPIYKSNVNTLFDSTATGFVAGKGVQMSTYCAACHTDYLATAKNQVKGTSGEGLFTKAFRHTTTSDSYTCVRCHYAHGTDVDVMMDAHGETVADLTAAGGAFVADTTKATAYMLDTNPSSALKRYTNMSVCWGCHTDSKAEQLKNTFSFGDDDGQTDPHGLPAQPDMPGALSATAITDGTVILP